MQDGPWDSSARLPHATTTVTSALQRDEWMLAPSTTSQPTVPQNDSRLASAKPLAMPDNDESFTEEYGEETGGKRTLGGGVDFFSSLGTERKKKDVVQKRDPEKVNLRLSTG